MASASLALREKAADRWPRNSAAIGAGDGGEGADNAFRPKPSAAAQMPIGSVEALSARHLPITVLGGRRGAVNGGAAPPARVPRAGVDPRRFRPLAPLHEPRRAVALPRAPRAAAQRVATE